MTTKVLVCAYIILSILSACSYGLDKSPQLNYDSAERTHDWMMMGVGSGICILLMILSLIVYTIHERQQNMQTKRSGGVIYENLSESPADTLPFPIQWNEEHYAQTSDLREDADTYSAPHNSNNIIDMYAQPQPKSSRINTNTKEVDNTVNESTYYNEVDLLDLSCNNPKYAQVVPKNLRNTMKAEDLKNYANITSSPNYAEVVPKSHRKHNTLGAISPSDRYPKIAPKPVLSNSSNYSNTIKKLNYAEVMHISNDRNKYDNVLPNNEIYANVNSNSEFVEPTYCELNKNN